MLAEHFPSGSYTDTAGLCKVATLAEIEAQGWSLNPGRYVGVGERAADGFDFAERVEALSEELVALGSEADALQQQVSDNLTDLLGRVG